MLDKHLRPLLEKPLRRLSAVFKKYDISPNAITLGSLILGLMCIPALATQHTIIALFCILLNRLGDGLDGALARETEISDFGGYLDSVCDFIFYGAVVFGFALADPEQNALPACILLFSFFGTGASFHTWAIFAHKYPDAQEPSNRSFAYLGGLTEGSETIILFIMMCLWPLSFPLFASVFSIACWITTFTRLNHAYKVMKPIP